MTPRFVIHAPDSHCATSTEATIALLEKCGDMLGRGLDYVVIRESELGMTTFACEPVKGCATRLAFRSIEPEADVGGVLETIVALLRRLVRDGPSTGPDPWEAALGVAHATRTALGADDLELTLPTPFSTSTIVAYGDVDPDILTAIADRIDGSPVRLIEVSFDEPDHWRSGGPYRQIVLTGPWGDTERNPDPVYAMSSIRTAAALLEIDLAALKPPAKGTPQ